MQCAGTKKGLHGGTGAVFSVYPGVVSEKAGGNSVKKAMGRYLKISRREAGLSQTEVAEKLGLSRNIISDYEMGRKLPTERDLRNMRRLYEQ